MDEISFGLGMPAKRFSLYAEDGVALIVNVWAPGDFRVPSAEHMLGQLSGSGKSPMAKQAAKKKAATPASPVTATATLRARARKNIGEGAITESHAAEPSASRSTAIAR